jgi:hypothetical protein
MTPGELMQRHDGGWHDITGVTRARTTGGAVPTLTQVGTSVFYAPLWQLNDEMWFEYHVPHDYIGSTSMYPHIHWFADGVDANTVKWELSYVTCKVGTAFDPENPTVINIEEASDGQYIMMHSNNTGGFENALLEPDTVVWIRMKRVANGATDNTDGIFVTHVNLDYRSSGMPSRNQHAPHHTE